MICMPASKVWDTEEMGGTDYIRSLSSLDLADYSNKSVLSNGEKWPDPRQWLGFRYIQVASSRMSSVYTKKKICERASIYKSLDAYNYGLCGHVQEVKFYDAGSEICI